MTCTWCFFLAPASRRGALASSERSSARVHFAYLSRADDSAEAAGTMMYMSPDSVGLRIGVLEKGDKRSEECRIG
jgi:hypothetical protein